MRFQRGLLAAAAALLLAAPLAARAAEPEPVGAGQESTGRVSVVDGGALFGRGPYDDETWELAPNAVLREGDEVFTESGTYAELEFPGGTFVRLDADTTVVIQQVGDPGLEIALAQGSVYASRASGARPVRIQTFGGGVELGGSSMARVGGAADRSRIDVKSAKGSAEMRTDRNAIAVPEGKTLVWTQSGSRHEAWGAASYDDFDRWNQRREGVVRGGSAPAQVASGVMGAYELEGNGTWVMIDGYWAWRPTVVYAGWRPYSYGYWTWCEPYGWTWVDYYGWGYTTCHYGRWYYRHAYGWVWYPDPYWAGAWVVWAAFGPHIGWAPCDFWGRPIYVYSYYSYYDYGAWCYIEANYFYEGGGYRTRDRVRTSTSRTSTSRGGAPASVGRSGAYQVRTFDAGTIRNYSPVPVRDSVRELTPRHVVEAAQRGAIKDVRSGDRGGELLSRAVKEGGVRPEPWAGRGRGADVFRGGDRTAAGGRDHRDPVRGGEGWGAPGGARDAGRHRDAARSSWGAPDQGNPDRGGAERGGPAAPARGGDPRQPDRGWAPRSNDTSSRGGSIAPPARSQPSGTPSSTPRKGHSDSNRKSDDSSNQSNDPGKSRPRASWGAIGSDRDGRGSRREAGALAFGSRRGGWSGTAPTGASSSRVTSSGGFTPKHDPSPALARSSPSGSVKAPSSSGSSRSGSGSSRSSSSSTSSTAGSSSGTSGGKRGR